MVQHRPSPLTCADQVHVGANTTHGGNNFRDSWGANGNASNPDRDSQFSHLINNGYSARFFGWTHTRPYANGLLQNSEDSRTPFVSVAGLEAGRYEYKLYAYGSHTNRVSIFSGTQQPKTCSQHSQLMQW